MLTSIFFAFVCIFAGILSFIVGGFGAWILLMQENPVQFRYYAAAIGLMLAGLSLAGVGQGLRLLLDINAE